MLSSTELKKGFMKTPSHYLDKSVVRFVETEETHLLQIMWYKTTTYLLLLRDFLAIFQSLQWLELTLLPNQLFVCFHMPAFYLRCCIVKNAWIILHIFAVKWKSPFGKYLGWFMLMINRLTMWTQNIWYKKARTLFLLTSHEIPFLFAGLVSKPKS